LRRCATKASFLTLPYHSHTTLSTGLTNREYLILLADEPSLGLSPNYLELIFDKLVEIKKAGTSILLVEQNASEALEIAHRAYVFSIGEVVVEDTGKNLLCDEKVKKAFLGG